VTADTTHLVEQSTSTPVKVSRRVKHKTRVQLWRASRFIFR